jgi:hypothetical protein
VAHFPAARAQLDHAESRKGSLAWTLHSSFEAMRWRRSAFSAVAIVTAGCSSRGSTLGAGAADGSPVAPVYLDADLDVAGEASKADASLDAGGDATDATDTGHDADAGDGAVDVGIDCTTDAGHPMQLGCTGLYSNWPSRTIAPTARAYTPGLVLWSDGAQKNRYIALPPGTRIDTSNMDEWTFPVGTKLWKEFRLNGAPVETRFLWKLAPGTWFRTTYAWSADGSSATELTTGQLDAVGTYEIPAQTACTACHQGRMDGVLGFEAVSLAASGASGLTLAELVAEGLLTNPPSSPLVVPGNATQSAALGWLHANCGTACHNRSPQSVAAATGLFMRLDVATLGSVQTTDTVTTAVGRPSNFQPTPTSNMLLIDPGNPQNSAIYFRDSFRDDPGQGFQRHPVQMPPIDTHVVPTAGVALVKAWIQSM